MPELRSRVVESTVERAERRAAYEHFDGWMALAAVVQAVPGFVWASPLILLFGFLMVAVGFNVHHLSSFIAGVLLWLSRLLIAGGVVLVVLAVWKCYKMYRAVVIDHASEQAAKANARKAIASARGAELKNELLEADIVLRQQIPQVILALTARGVAFEYDAKGNLKVLGPAGRTMINQIGGVSQEQIAGAGSAGLLGAGDELPTNVLYEDIRGRIPSGHVLVGVGRGGLIDTVEAAIGACVWIVGLSGTGKTSTTVLRVEERANMGYSFLGVDPHFFKDDSLYHAIYETVDGRPGPYRDAFAKPMARSAEETNAVLNFFLSEFYARKGGKRPRRGWRPLTLLVDEVGSLMDALDPLEKENADLIKRIARICGQEARNFLMGGVFISQQATGLAWLRKVALMVIVHQLLMASEKELACNGDRAVMKDMEHWPIGRTYVFGVGFGADGARTVQQPYFAGRRASVEVSEPDDAAFDDDELEPEEDDESGALKEDDHVIQSPDLEQDESEVSPPPPALSGDLRKVYDACQQLMAAGQPINARGVGQIADFGKDKANALLNRLTELGYIERRNNRAG
jgi:hypothetical protein